MFRIDFIDRQGRMCSATVSGACVKSAIRLFKKKRRRFLKSIIQVVRI